MITCTYKEHTGFLRHAVTDNLVLKDDKILLIKRAPGSNEGGKWGLAGGYLEQNETIKEGAVREIMEETGYEVENLTLLRIIDTPNRPNEDLQNIAFVHFCTALEKIGTPDDESTEQKWFPLSDIPPADEIAFDHFENIQLYREYLKNPSSLPLQ